MRRQALAQAQSAAAAGCASGLARLGDWRADRDRRSLCGATALDSVAFLDGSEMGKLLEAVATLGGDEAKSYLRFVSTSHPEASLRDEAKAALQRLEKRSGTSAGHRPVIPGGAHVLR